MAGELGQRASVRAICEGVLRACEGFEITAEAVAVRIGACFFTSGWLAGVE
jgi:hypothetical protein